jgi:hypothetical protein
MSIIKRILREVVYGCLLTFEAGTIVNDITNSTVLSVSACCNTCQGWTFHEFASLQKTANLKYLLASTLKKKDQGNTESIMRSRRHLSGMKSASSRL